MLLKQSCSSSAYGLTLQRRYYMLQGCQLLARFAWLQITAYYIDVSQDIWTGPSMIPCWRDLLEVSPSHIIYSVHGIYLDDYYLYLEAITPE